MSRAIKKSRGKVKSDIARFDPRILEVGDNFSFLTKQLAIRNKSNFIILCKIEYEDIDRFRQFINEKLLNNSYTIYKWAFYDYKKENKYLSALSLDLKEKYKKELLKRIEE